MENSAVLAECCIFFFFHHHNPTINRVVVGVVGCGGACGVGARTRWILREIGHLIEINARCLQQ